jgi:WD40 repeat protein
MKTLKMLVLGAALMTGLVACPRENIIFSTDTRIVRGNWVGTAKRVCANVSQTAWSPDATKIVSNGKRTVIWDATTGARVRVIAEQSQQVVWTPTSVITVSGSTYGEKGPQVVVKFWNPTTGVLERSLNVFGDFLVVNPDGTRGISTIRDSGLSSARVVSLTDGSTVRNLSFAPPANATRAAYYRFSWTPDGKRIVAEGSIEGLRVATSPVPLPSGVRIWSASTGEIERDFLGSFSSLSFSPDAKTLAYSDATSSLKLLNLETGEVRSVGSAPGSTQYSVIGWNPSGSKIYVQASEGAVTEVWNLGTLKLEQSLPQTSGYGWNSLGAPVDTGVISYAQYEDCALKILDLTTLKTTRTLDETILDPLEVKLSLQATYLNESEYRIAGTAAVGAATFTVRGSGSAGSGRLLPQTPPPLPMSANLEFLDANNTVIWRMPNLFDNAISNQGNQKTFVGMLTQTPASANGAYDSDGYNFKLTPAP